MHHFLQIGVLSRTPLFPVTQLPLQLTASSTMQPPSSTNVITGQHFCCCTLSFHFQSSTPFRTRSAANMQPPSLTNAITIFEQATVSVSDSHCHRQISTSKMRCRRSGVQLPWKLQQPSLHVSQKHLPSTAQPLCEDHSSLPLPHFGEIEK